MGPDEVVDAVLHGFQDEGVALEHVVGVELVVVMPCTSIVVTVVVGGREFSDGGGRKVDLLLVRAEARGQVNGKGSWEVRGAGDGGFKGFRHRKRRRELEGRRATIRWGLEEGPAGPKRCSLDASGDALPGDGLRPRR